MQAMKRRSEVERVESKLQRSKEKDTVGEASRGTIEREDEDHRLE